MQLKKIVLWWLFTGAVLVFVQVAIGGITRLTHSGLSIVDWSPIVGTLPPLSEESWQTAFDKYRLSPEFIHINHHFTLSDFKGIFWWEYFHRLFGRIIGLVFIIPFAWFVYKGVFTRRQILLLGGVFFLGAVQAVLGWYMVKSGLINEPRVSHYRLAAHLLTAFITCLLILRIALPIFLKTENRTTNKGLKRWSESLLMLGCLQVVYGAFVAGLRAGGSHNSYPKMDSQWIADGVWAMRPFWSNFTEGVSGVQFVHRVLAHMLLFIAIWLWLKRKTIANNQIQIVWINVFASIVLLQFSLGVFTLLLRVPLILGVAHQAGALLMLSAALILWFISTENSQSNTLNPL